jgi:hypothetical protein
MHWCLGTYASASTWIYNVTLKVAAALYPGRSVVGRFVTSFNELDLLVDAAHIFIAKTHDLDPMAEAALAQYADAILVSIRDPRDCLASLLTYQKLSFDDALGKVVRSATISGRFADHPNAVLLRYEDQFSDDPRTIDRIARTFGHQLAAEDCNRIFAETRRSVVESFIAELDSLPTVFHHTDPLETLDLTTQWHRHHRGRTGEVGRWRRELTQSQSDEVEQNLRPFMECFGYPGE